MANISVFIYPLIGLIIVFFICRYVTNYDKDLTFV